DVYNIQGVMKAIGIPDYQIRLLYTVKYLAVSALGAAAGLALSFPLGTLLLKSASRNIILSERKMIPVHFVCAFLTAALIVLFCWFCTRKIRSFSPIDAIRSGETGERYTGKGLFGLNRSRLAPPLFLAVNDISGGLKRYASMLAIFTIGILLVTIPSNTINTLSSDRLVTLFNMAECDHVITREALLSFGGSNKEYLLSGLEDIKNTLAENGIEAEVFQELVFRMNVSRGDLSFSSLAFQSIGDVTTDRYVYIDGTPPQNSGEIALSYLTAENIGAKIGDDVRITVDGQTRTYLLTAINQSLNNNGEAVRFHPDAELDYSRCVGSFGIQIRYTGHPDKKELDHYLELLRSLYPDDDIRPAGEYINLMIGDVAGQFDSIRSLIFGIVLCINLLVTVLMVKSFITKEKGEIALLRAIGFSSVSLIAWQAMRIGLVLLLAAVLGALLSTPLTRLMIEPIFRMMGAYSISFEIRVFEVYIVCPLIIFIAATAAAALSACQLKKIPASEVSNIE
ncbi:MAG: hypothetical protein K2N94_09525, partial [Lachnospiraceae bacterium]|nr:hypothetical protein [Lachnospiraceae bacterium]